MATRQKQRVIIIFFSAALLFCSFVILSLSKDGFAFTIPDTGQTKCYDTAGAEIACAGTGQDGAYNINPMSFTDNGNGTVTDNVTGLLWQKEDDNTKRTWADAGTYCESLTLGGQSGWRLPANKELMSIFEYTNDNTQTYSTTYFTNIKHLDYWSSVTVASDTSYAWSMSFRGGSFLGILKSEKSDYVRCVRGVQASPSFKDNGNGTVTDNVTGLIWQQGEQEPMTWANAPSSCKGLSLGGQNDWRLPNIKELASITDDIKYNPSIDTTYFPNTKREDTDNSYWSSTTSTPNAGVPYAFGMDYRETKLDFGGTPVIGGNITNGAKSNSWYARCVRGGQNNCAATLSGNFLLHEPYFTINGSSLWLDLQYAQDAQFPSTDLMFKLSNAGGVTTPADYSNCQASALSVVGNNYVLHIPVLILGGTSYWLDLTYVPTSDGLLWFKLTGVGVNT